jgi:hypothetical protein
LYNKAKRNVGTDAIDTAELRDDKYDTKAICNLYQVSSAIVARDEGLSYKNKKIETLVASYLI